MACLANPTIVKDITGYVHTAAHQVRLQPARSRPHASQPINIASSKVCGCHVAIRGIPRCDGKARARPPATTALCSHALKECKIHTGSLKTIMQLASHSGLVDLLTHRVVPGLRLQDLQSLAACCSAFQDFVEGLPQHSWLLVAR